MPVTLADWEKRFAQAIGLVECAEGRARAVLLPIVPDRPTWDTFVACIGEEWKAWKGQLSQHPSCRVMLYCGLAFYEYDENTFWPQFAKAVGSERLPVNQQTDINGAFAIAADHFRLKVKRATAELTI